SLLSSNALGWNTSPSSGVQESMSGGLRHRAVRVLAVVGGLIVLLGGGAYAVASRGSDSGTRGEASGPPSTGSLAPTTAARPSTTEAPTTTTEPAPTTTAPAAAPQPDGSVRDLQQRLADLGYDIGPIDGLWGSRTYYTVEAFQRVEGL